MKTSFNSINNNLFVQFISFRQGQKWVDKSKPTLVDQIKKTRLETINIEMPLSQIVLSFLIANQ
jgi:hypothetical protein